MRLILIACYLLCAILALASQASAVIIETVPVGNPGNAADPTNLGIHYGAVAYNYRIGTYEVTNTQYAEFLNAKAASDPFKLYEMPSLAASPNGDASQGIIRSGSGTSANPYTYAVRLDMGNKPVNYVDWYDAIRFANWMNNGQGSGDTETGAYTIGPPNANGNPTNGLSITRNPGASWYLPSQNEWYKAAFHQPAAQGGDIDDYWRYATSSNSLPTIATANSIGDISNPADNVVNYNLGADWNGRNGNVTSVGSAGPLSASFYGTYDQGGNVFEWAEGLFVGQFRGFREGSWERDSYYLESETSLLLTGPTAINREIGFRLVFVPEPSTIALATVGAAALGCFAVRRRFKSALI